MPNQKKISPVDLAKNAKDTVTNKIFDSTGKVASDMDATRKELVEALVLKLQNTVTDTLSGLQISGPVDSLGNSLFELNTYAESLKEGASSILDNYPRDDQDEPLHDLVELCDIISEGVANVNGYLDAVRKFASDLDNIHTEVYTRVQQLHMEI